MYVHLELLVGQVAKSYEDKKASGQVSMYLRWSFSNSNLDSLLDAKVAFERFFDALTCDGLHSN